MIESNLNEQTQIKEFEKSLAVSKKPNESTKFADLEILNDVCENGDHQLANNVVNAAQQILLASQKSSLNIQKNCKWKCFRICGVSKWQIANRRIMWLHKKVFVVND
jgi:hypothetical protein